MALLESNIVVVVDFVDFVVVVVNAVGVALLAVITLCLIVVNKCYSQAPNGY